MMKQGMMLRSFNFEEILSKFSLTSLTDINAYIDYLRYFLKRSNYIPGVLALVGILFYKPRFYIYFILLAFITASIILLGYTRDYSDRYFLIFIVLFIPVAAQVLYSLFKSENKVIKCVSVIIVVVSLVQWADKVFKRPDVDKLARKEAGLLIQEHVGKGNDVFSNRHAIAFYADSNYFSLINNPDPLDGGSLALKFPGWEDIGVKTIFSKDGKLVKTVAIDSLVPEGHGLMENLATLGINPDYRINTINIWLPKE